VVGVYTITDYHLCRNQSPTNVFRVGKLWFTYQTKTVLQCFTIAISYKNKCLQEFIVFMVNNRAVTWIQKEIEAWSLECSIVWSKNDFGSKYIWQMMHISAIMGTYPIIYKY
jgi:hypothetical protein